jgi:serine/threonine protein kinase/dienelactone hydrolase
LIDNWKEISRIFNAALEIEPAARSRFLNENCPDQSLRGEIETLLEANEGSDSFIDSPRASLKRDGDGLSIVRDQLFGSFQIIDKIGAGGMGEVYLARDTRLNRRVALKFLTLPDENSNRRFLREAQAAAALEHPHICTIHEIGKANGLDFIVMQYVEGQTLADLIKSGRLGLVEALEIAIQVAQALAVAHGRGIVHRDIKPANIIVSSDNQIKVLDFGLAKRIVFDDDNPDSSLKTLLSQPGMVVGTVSYMSPEQVRGAEIDARGDLWSLGVVIYEMIAGYTPFGGESTVEKLAEVLYKDPRPMPKTPAALEAIVMKSLSKSPADRYQTADELCVVLDDVKKDFEFAEQLQIHATSGARDSEIHDTLTQYLSEHRSLSGSIPPPRRKIVRGFAAALILVAAIAVLWYWYGNYRARKAADDLNRVEELARADKNFEAYDLALTLRAALASDERLAALMPTISVSLSVTSEPSGARVYVRRFQVNQDGKFPERQLIGETPVANLTIARGNYILELEKDGFETSRRTISGAIPRVGGSFIESPPLTIETRMIESSKNPPKMVFVPGGDYSLVNWSRSTASKVALSDFFLDRYEVSNADYKEFINAGGYVRPELWKVPFERDSKPVTMAAALALLKDRTGLPGPRSWSNQNFPDGAGDLPVTDITWYEAAAYAEFRGKKLPTVFQWEKAARDGMFDPRYNAMPWGFIRQGDTTDRRANFRGTGPVAVTDNEYGMSPFGALNMAGNVSEWTSNESEEGFVTSGGAWNDLAYSFGDYGIYPGLYTSNRIGFRCVLSRSDSDQGGQMIPHTESPVYKPSSESDFRTWLTHYEYDRKALNATVAETTETDSWTREKITFPTESNETAIAYLYLPKNAARPVQVIHYVPPGDVVRGIRSLNDSIEMFAAPFVKSGRAVFAIVLKGYTERPFPQNYSLPANSTVEFRKQVVNWITDLRRGVDYLESRADIDHSRIAFLGISNGANVGLILTAIETRYKTLVFESAGLESEFRTRIAETSPIKFASQIKIQKLVINGRYDETFPFNTDAKPLFELLREPKKIVIYEGGHIPTPEFFIPAVNGWLDETLGPVAR